MKYLAFLVALSLSIRLVRLEVSWSIRTDPVVIGHNLELFCNTTLVGCTDCASQWQIDNQLLTFYDSAVNPEKFDVVHEQGGFTLVIKNLTYEHIHRNYECSYSYHLYTNTLALPHNYEHHPTANTVNSTYTVDGKSLQINILFEAVRPAPVCYAYLNGKNLSSEMNTYIKNKERFYEATVKLNHTFVDASCNGQLLLHCLTGSKNETYIDTHLDLECKDSTISTWSTVAIVVGSLVFFVITCVLIVCLCLRRLKDRKNTETNLKTQQSSEMKSFIELPA